MLKYAPNFSRLFILPAIILLLLFSLSCNAICSNGPLRVYLAIYRGGQYVEPFSREITVTQQPTPFHIVIKNVSGSSQQIYEKSSSGAYGYVGIEVINEEGRKTIVKKREESASSSMTGFSHLNPGEEKVIKMLLDPYEWENVPILERGKVKYFKIRAYYYNKAKHIYSDYYEIVLDGR